MPAYFMLQFCITRAFSETLLFTPHKNVGMGGCFLCSNTEAFFKKESIVSITFKVVNNFRSVGFPIKIDSIQVESNC